MEGFQIELSTFVEEELLAECRFYAEEYSDRYAEKFRNSFYETVASILPYPLKFPECFHLKTKSKKYRNIIWGNYLIVFRVYRNRIRVLCLFHTKNGLQKLR